MDIPGPARFRSLFPITADWAYFDHAAVAPLPTTAQAAMAAFGDDHVRHGYLNEPVWDTRVETTRAKAARLMGAEADEVAFVQNTSQGLSLLANGLPWTPGDNVVSASAEYPANVFPWMNLRRFGVETRLVSSRPDGRIARDDLVAAVDDRTRLVSLSFVEFSNGFRNDLAAIGDFCHSRRIWFAVDVIQGLGALRLDLGRLPVDFAAAAAHKWLLGPLGIGLVYCRRGRVDQLWPAWVGYGSMVPGADYLEHRFDLRPEAARFESGTQNFTGIFGLEASLDLLLEVGLETIEGAVLGRCDRLVEGLARRGYQTLSPLGSAERSGIVAFRRDGHSTDDVVERLARARVKVCRRGHGVRASPHFYNTDDEIDRLLDALPS